MATRVFISSTSRDLHDYREAAITVCNQLKMVPIAMEFFEAMGVGATSGSKSKVDESDLYVGIFAHRYGYVEEGYDKAVTEIEFDYAGGQGLERLCFLVDPSYPWPPDAIDYKQLDRLNTFKSRINTLIRAQFTTVDNFQAKLIHALVEWQRRHPDKADASISSTAPDALPTTVPPLPTLVIGREGDFGKLKSRLGIGGTKQSQTIIRGWPGVGKTTVVSALAYDTDVVDAFPGGILWASIGENPNHFAELNKWGRALGADLSNAKTLDDAILQVRALLREKRALLIVDDIWAANDAVPFMVGGLNCATLYTTRFGDIARQIATTPDEVYVLGTLGEDQGIELLRQVAPSVTDNYLNEMRQLVDDLEGLPLALRVAGRLLETEASSGFDVRDSFHLLRESAALLEDKAPDDRFDPHTGTTPTIGLLLKKSTDTLDPETQDYFAFLGAFAPKPATFDLDAMRGVWMVDNAKPIVLKLVDRGLLEPIPSIGRFWMHALLVMHAKSLLTDDEE